MMLTTDHGESLRKGLRRSAIFGTLLLVSGAVVGACAAGSGPGGVVGSGGGESSAGGAGGVGQGGQGGVTVSSSGTGGQGGDVGFLDGGIAQGSGGGSPDCVSMGPDVDGDGDGFTPQQGDCNDCDPNANPGAIEVSTGMGTGVSDEDCDGAVDEPSETCDNGLVLDSLDPLDGARAVELCKTSQGPGDWGVVVARWVLSDGSPPPAVEPQLGNFHLGHGILSGFGPNVQVRGGNRLLALSSGTARRPGDPGFAAPGSVSLAKNYKSSHPQGFPKESPACPNVNTGQPNDAAGLELDIRVPSNAYGFSFDFNFYTSEWPTYICRTFNDFFVAILSPIPPGQPDGNISFDQLGNPVSVNNAFLEVCGCAGNPPNPCVAGGKTFPCSRGEAELLGTGFGAADDAYNKAATSWLSTKAPVVPGSQITIRWAIYDSADGFLDSTALVDNWQWVANPGVAVETLPIPK